MNAPTNNADTNTAILVGAFRQIVRNEAEACVVEFLDGADAKNMAELSGRVMDLNTTSNAHGGDIADLKHGVAELESKLDGVNTDDLLSIVRRMEELDTKVDDMDDEIERQIERSIENAFDTHDFDGVIDDHDISRQVSQHDDRLDAVEEHVEDMKKIIRDGEAFDDITVVTTAMAERIKLLEANATKTDAIVNQLHMRLVEMEQRAIHNADTVKALVAVINTITR